MSTETERHCLVTGGTGFIGQHLCQHLTERGWQLTVLTRQGIRAAPFLPPKVDLVERFADISHDRRFTAVVNLAGEPIADRRWSASRKQQLEDSRVGLTAHLVAWMRNTRYRPQVLISGSAIGWYGDCGDQELNETDGAHDEYTHRLCNAWENTALGAEALGVRTCLLRTGLVVGPGGGFLSKMLLPFRLGLGGPIGSGSQWMSWVHRNDLVAMIGWLISANQQSGAFNGTAPQPVTNREFSSTLGRVLNRPAVVPLPAPLLKLALGEASRLLLTGQKVLPLRAFEGGFRFEFVDLEDALRNALGTDP